MSHLKEMILICTILVPIIVVSTVSCRALVVPAEVSTVGPPVPYVYDMALDASKNIICVSYDGCVVFQINSTGRNRWSSALMTTIAGVYGSIGSDDGIGPDARFSNPYGVDVDVTNNVAYICDYNNHIIRRMDLHTRSVTLFAGNVGLQGSVNGPLTTAQFTFPSAITIWRSAVLYVVDSGNQAIRKIVISTGVVSTVVSIANCVTKAGYTLYVSSSHKIFRVNLLSNVTSFLAGSNLPGFANGSGTVALFRDPRGIALNNDESSLIIADKNHRIRRLDLTSSAYNVTTVAGKGTTGSTNGGPQVALFKLLHGAKWLCNKTNCGVLAADYTGDTSELYSFCCMEDDTTSSATPTASHSHQWSNKLQTASLSPNTKKAHFLYRSATSVPSSDSGRHERYRHPKHFQLPSGPVAPQKPSFLHRQRQEASRTLAMKVSVSNTLTPSKTHHSSTSETVATTFPSLLSYTDTTESTTLTTHTASPSSASTLVSASIPSSLTRSHPLLNLCSIVLHNGTASLGSVNISAINNVVSNITFATIITESTFPISVVAGSGSGSGESFLTVQPLPRSILLQAPALAMNLSVLSQASTVQWRVIKSPSSASPFLKWMDLSDSQGGTWYSVVVIPPASGWISNSVSQVVDLNFFVRIDFECRGTSIFSASINVPAPGALRELANAVEVATRASQIVSALAGGASSGSALGRVMATRSMVMCNADAAVGGGVIDFGLTLCRVTAGSTGGVTNARSAIVSNCALILTLAAVLFILVAVYSQVCQLTTMDSTLQFCLPSTLLPVFLAILSSTAAATTLIAARIDTSTCVALDGFFVSLGFLTSVASPLALFLLWLYCGSGKAASRGESFASMIVCVRFHRHEATHDTKWQQTLPLMKCCIIDLLRNSLRKYSQ
ncbi:membrane-associated protein, putative [Bodo saltans]|uniref:Membrane-associated protein, putative n=1 Tax=Bodo saltans TaxID=75058 RepID=A0A0S4J2T2_BODSA|nr:membrane-associated protein, putative [Bodo saltans]|eukprot:CUG63685.1 membrane-associated protein, putative [Bodo saltans]